MPKDNNKTKRQQIIETILKEQVIRTQDDLLLTLRKRGIEATQATLSRDIREMRIFKSVDQNHQAFYALPSQSPVSAPLHDIIMPEHGIWMEISGQLMVLHTKPGHASMVASIVDDLAIPGVMGTLAGDDTVLVMLRVGYNKRAVEQQLLSGLNK